MASLTLFKKAATVAIGLVLRRSSTVEGLSTIVWEAKGLPNHPPLPSLLLYRPYFEWTKSINGGTPIKFNFFEISE
jgi:hypothetical protein